MLHLFPNVRSPQAILFPAILLAVGLSLAPPPATAQVRTLRATAYAGKRYVALADLAALYGLPLHSSPQKKISIHGKYTHLEFTGENRRALVNGTLVWLHAPVYQVRGKWSISDADAQYLIDPLVRPTAYIGARGAHTVILDPGHGGKDPGAISTSGRQEKKLALDIALRVRTILLAAGVRVPMTRDRDRFVDLAARPAAARKTNADLFVSIHLNATANPAVHGIETYITPVENFPPTAESRLHGKYPRKPNNAFNHSNSVLGFQIQKALLAITRAEDRGLRHARFLVIRESSVPAALIECGYLSNPSECNRLSMPSYRDALAQGIAQGILNYLALVNQAKRGAPTPMTQPPHPTPPTPPTPAPPAPTAPMPPPAPTSPPTPAPANPECHPAPPRTPPPSPLPPHRPIAAPPGHFLAPDLLPTPNLPSPG